MQKGVAGWTANHHGRLLYSIEHAEITLLLTWLFYWYHPEPTELGGCHVQSHAIATEATTHFTTHTLIEEKRVVVIVHLA